MSRMVIKNGEHSFVFLPQSGNLGRCQGPCRMIVTRKEAEKRPFGPCIANAIGSPNSSNKHSD